MKTGKILLCVWVAVIFAILPIQAGATSLLGTAGEFNTFIFGDYYGSSDAEGRMAIGGNARLDHFSVADKLSAEEAALYEDMLIVGGDLTFNGGQVYNGDVVVGGSADGVDSSVRWGLINNGYELETTDSLPVDFKAEEEYLKAASGALSELETNGTSVYQWGGLTLTGDNTSSYQVFNIDGADLLSSWGIASISGIPADATVVINVSGKNAGMVNANFNALVPIRNKVLFNFYEADTLTFKGVGVEGSVLAPYADVVDPQGVINGTIIAKSWSGSMQQNHQLFTGNIDLDIPTGNTETPAPTPEPATFALFGLGLIGLVCFRNKKS